jgi:hypothetical protein
LLEIVSSIGADKGAVVNNILKTHCGYDAGHPWYYLLGGAVPYPKQIRAQVIARGYRGYMEERITSASKRPEPQRSEALRALKLKVHVELRGNLSRYRELAYQLYAFRENSPLGEGRPECHDIHTSMRLKFAHIYNDFAHLNYIDTLPNQQQDMFELL